MGDTESRDVFSRLSGQRLAAERMSPVACTMPEIARSVVVFPAPLAPSSVVTPPSATVSSSPNSTWVAP
jgi:hypothetical protein